MYGPPLLRKQVFFIDDLNMPALDTFGAQPPLELVRQFMDFRGNSFQFIILYIFFNYSMYYIFIKSFS